MWLRRSDICFKALCSHVNPSLCISVMRGLCVQDADGAPADSAATDADPSPHTTAIASSVGAADAPDPGGGGVNKAAKQAIAVVSAADAGSGKPQAAGGVIRKPRPDALLLSFSEYKPVEHAVWEAGQPTPYLHLAQAFQVCCDVHCAFTQPHGRTSSSLANFSWDIGRCTALARDALMPSSTQCTLSRSFASAHQQSASSTCCSAGQANHFGASWWQAMEGTKKRLIISAVLTNMFRSVLALSPGAARIVACVHRAPRHLSTPLTLLWMLCFCR